MAVKLAFNEFPQQVDENGAPLVGAQLFTYVAGSSTKQTTFQDSGGSTPNENPIEFDASGRPPYPIWLTTGVSYKFVLAPADDTDPPTSPIWTLDNITGINDTSSAQDQWVSGATPTFVSTTSFTLVGDQTSTYHVGRRVKTTNSGGTVYSTISASVFGVLTTITVGNDSGVLDSGLSALSYSVLTNVNQAIPSVRAKGDLLTLSAAGTMARQAVGTDGYVLKAESGTTNGLLYSPDANGLTLMNGYLDWSVAASALTVAVKTWAGADPSSADPVYVQIRSATAATGLPTVIKITAATSVVVSSGSTLGTTSNIAFRVWVVGFNDAATFRLGVINCRSGQSTYQLSPWQIATSTAEGGAGGADSAAVFYTGSAVAAKGYSILGYATWESGLGTAGTWSAGPTRSQLFGPGVPLPGAVVQCQRTQDPASASGTTQIPLDNTIPQITEGVAFLLQAITPTSASNLLKIRVLAQQGLSNTGALVGALFQDATVDALAAVAVISVTGSGGIVQVQIDFSMVAGTTSATTLRYRAGPTSALTIYLNNSGGTALFNGTSNSVIQVEEVMV